MEKKKQGKDQKRKFGFQKTEGRVFGGENSEEIRKIERR